MYGVGELKTLEMVFLTEDAARKLAEQRLFDAPLDVRAIIDDYPEFKDCDIYEGKVTTSIFGDRLIGPDGTPLRIMIRTPRISTHDVGRGTIPFKGQVLARNHDFIRKLVRNQLPHAQQDIMLPEDSIVTVSHNLEMIPVEFVLRKYNAYTTTSTSLYQHYMAGERTFCGHDLPDDLVSNGELPELIDTPSTKEANDRSVSPEELFHVGACTEEQYRLMKVMAFGAFSQVSDYLARKDIILADTKLEFGLYVDSGEIVAIDELFTMDSSRFWPVENWRAVVGNHAPVLSWSKEFARGFSKGDDPYTDEERVEIAVRYLLGIQELTGQLFEPNMDSPEKQVRDSLDYILSYYGIS